jgi:hypothetical protein
MGSAFHPLNAIKQKLSVTGLPGYAEWYIQLNGVAAFNGNPPNGVCGSIDDGLGVCGAGGAEDVIVGNVLDGSTSPWVGL